MIDTDVEGNGVINDCISECERNSVWLCSVPAHPGGVKVPLVRESIGS